MWNKFKDVPLTVKMAIGFLTVMITLLTIYSPSIMIPVLVMVLGVISLLRIFVYLVHRE